MIKIPLWLGIVFLYLFFKYVEPKLKKWFIGE